MTHICGLYKLRLFTHGLSKSSTKGPQARREIVAENAALPSGNEYKERKDELDIIWDQIKAEHEAKKQGTMFEEPKTPALPKGITSDDVIRVFPGAEVQTA